MINTLTELDKEKIKQVIHYIKTNIGVISFAGNLDNEQEDIAAILLGSKVKITIDVNPENSGVMISIENEIFKCGCGLISGVYLFPWLDRKYKLNKTVLIVAGFARITICFDKKFSQRIIKVIKLRDKIHKRIGVDDEDYLENIASKRERMAERNKDFIMKCRGIDTSESKEKKKLPDDFGVLVAPVPKARVDQAPKPLIKMSFLRKIFRFGR